MNSKLHRARVIITSPRYWRRRAIFWLGAIFVGAAASGFAILVSGAHHIFDEYLAPNRYWLLLLSPALFALSAWLTQRFCPEARGSGIPQAIAARILRDRNSRKKLIGMRSAIGKVILTLIGVLAGASIGREGPTVQIGAAVMFYLTYSFGLRRQKGVVLAGAAAGVAAAFNTPLAGVVFAIEEMARAFEYRNSSIILVAIVLAGATAMSIMGNYDYFGYTSVAISIAKDWSTILVCGVAGGVLGGLAAISMINGGTFIRSLVEKRGVTFHPIIFAACCGLVIAVLGIMTAGDTFGSGYTLGAGLLHGDIEVQWWHFPAKFVATIVSSISGIPGGILSPSLSIGATMGAELGTWLPLPTQMAGLVIIGMAAYFSGTTQAPITSFIIVLEITGGAVDPMPLMAAAVLATGVSRLICPDSLYHAMAKSFLRAAKAAEHKSDKIIDGKSAKSD